jgi:DNA-binding transcriptional LysR family regulator
VLINLELLRTFVAAAKTHTFREAGASRHVTASAISQQVKALESQLGIVLFERTGKFAHVTEDGRRLAEQLKISFDTVDEALERAVSSHREVAGPVRIGAPRPFGRVWLRPRLVGLLRKHPLLELHIAFGVPTKLERKLVDRELDLVILVRAARLEGVETEPIYTEQFGAWAAPSYMSANGPLASPEDVRRHRFIVFDDDLPMHSVWWRAMFGPDAEFRGPIACRVASLDEMLALAVEGLGIAVLPDYFVRESADGKDLVEVDAECRPSRRPATNAIFLAWRRRGVPTARFLAVRDALLR